MKKVLLTTSAIVGLWPSLHIRQQVRSTLLHHSHPMNGQKYVCVFDKLVHQDADDATQRHRKKTTSLSIDGVSLTALNGNGPGDPTASTGVG